jgi:predicted transcriptional regulator
MIKRLQVLLEDDELMAIQELARKRHQTTAAWVRDALRKAREETVYPEAVRKLRAVREASTFAYPVTDIDPMLAEIERGYRDESSS